MPLATVQSWTVGAAVALFLLVSALLAREGRSNRSVTTAGILFCAGAASRALLTEPAFLSASRPLLVIFMILCLGHAAAFLTFSRTLFEEDSRIRFHDVMLWLVLVASGLLIFGGGILHPDLPRLYPMFTATEMLLAMMALAAAWRGIGGDLVESRRNARFAFVALASLHVLALGLTEVALNTAALADQAALFNTSGLVVIAIGLAFAVAGLRADGAVGAGPLPRPAKAGSPSLVAVRAGNNSSEFALAEVNLFERLMLLMRSERIYRDESLTIRKLAARLGTSERLLRRLINRRLGYRNFNTYLNEQRLDDVRQALRDEDQTAVPIATIALDAGFNSLGPFYRAFKEAEGLTPTEYRARFCQPIPGYALLISASG